MGFFSKLSENMHHGGIKLSIEAPGKISMEAAELPVTVTLVASEAKTIKRVRADILATQQDIAFNSMNAQQPNQMANQQVIERLVARSEITEPFTMAAGETKTVQLNIVMNSAQAALSRGNLTTGQATVANIFAKLQDLNDAANPNAYKYSVKATADVDGIALDPSAKVGISINKPGQFGSTTNIHL